MSQLKHRQEKIQEKRKQTPWRQFVLELCSHTPLVLHKNTGALSRYPDTGRMGQLVTTKEFQEMRESFIKESDPSGDTFFDKFQMLWKSVPRALLQHDFVNSNCNYSDVVFGASNAYLSYVVGFECDSVFYSLRVLKGSKDIVNSGLVSQQSQIVMNSYLVNAGFRIFYSRGIDNSSDLRFCSNMIGCTHCLLSDGLENQSYCINNKQYTKDEYMTLKDVLLKQKENYDTRFTQLPKVRNLLVEACTGNGLRNCEDIENALYTTYTSHGRNIIAFEGSDHSTMIYDTVFAGINCHHFYGVANAGNGMDHIYLSINVGTSNNIYYSSDLQGCSYCFGCIGLISMDFCIFNVQYTKEERYEKVEELFKEIEDSGDLGKIFPGSLNPFYFNDTVAYLLDDSFTKEEVEAAGYLRRDEEIKVDIPEGVEVIGTSELDRFEGFDDDGVRTISSDILKKVIKDEKGNCYKIIKKEYDYYMKHGLPLPRKHWLERIKLAFSS